MYKFARIIFTPRPSFAAHANLAGMSQVLIFPKGETMPQYIGVLNFLSIVENALNMGTEYTISADAIATSYIDGDLTEGTEYEVLMTKWEITNDEYHWAESIPCGSFTWESISDAEQDAIVDRMPQSN